MRPILDVKSQNTPGAQNAPANASSVVKENATDHFALKRENRAMLTVHRAAVRFHGASQTWWKELQPLIDALPNHFRGTDVELSEVNKEALRELARLAPHKEISTF